MEEAIMELVFIPSPGVGHLISTVEMAKILLQKRRRLSISVLLTKLPFESEANSYADSILAAGDDRLKLTQVVAKDPIDLTAHAGKATFFRYFIESHKPGVRDAVNDILNSVNSVRLAGFMVDMFCADMVDVANEFGVPTYVYYTSGAAILGLHLHLQSLRDDAGVDVTEFEDSDPDLDIPSYPTPFPVKLLPPISRDKSGGGSDMFFDIAKRIRETKGIMVNTFSELEHHALNTLCEDNRVPPVYPVGPVLNLKGNNSNESEKEIMKWLDGQPEASVVFLCFGSAGSFHESQAREIARALERSGQRFLWALRRPAREGSGSLYPSDYDNLEEVLPEGFLERTKNIGKVIGWAPQTAVLAHPAVGGFVSHCGWNSTLESVWFGVPMATWPMYAEQQANAFQLVTEIGIAVEIKMDYVKDPMVKTKEVEDVTADEIETGIRSLMDRSAANPLRIRAKELKEISRKALEEGGSSSDSLERFFELVLSNLK